MRWSDGLRELGYPMQDSTENKAATCSPGGLETVTTISIIDQVGKLRPRYVGDRKLSVHWTTHEDDFLFVP